MEFNAIFSVKEVTDLIVPSKQQVYNNALSRRQKLFKQIWKERTPEKATIKNLFLYYDLRTSLADDLLMYTDKITMHFGLECRVPILDNDLIDFIESLDSRYKYNSNKGKIIHKDFAREFLPSAIIERKKLGFKSPTEVWFRENKNIFEDILTTLYEYNRCFNLNTVKNLFRKHREGKNLEKQIFLLLNICHILKQNNAFNAHRNNTNKIIQFPVQ